MDIFPSTGGAYIPIIVRPNLDGVQAIFRFTNGYGASVVRFSGSYGVELAIAKFNSESLDDWDFVCNTGIDDGSGIVGWLTPDNLIGILCTIECFPDILSGIQPVVSQEITE